MTDKQLTDKQFDEQEECQHAYEQIPSMVWDYFVCKKCGDRRITQA